MRRPVSEKTLEAVARKVAANKAEIALTARGKSMTAAEVRDACGFRSTALASRVLGGLVRRGIARTLPASVACATPKTWFLVPASEVYST